MTVSVATNRLVMDLGMNNGDDTAYYLAKGYDVVALEANPRLASAGRARFALEIAAKRLTLVEAAIWKTSGIVTFHVNDDNDHWSSIEPCWAGRDDTATHPVDVPAVTLGDLFKRHGSPFYLKIDVEGVDGLVLDQLREQPTKPSYVSVEDCRFGFDYIETLAAAGYDGFKLLDQSTVGEMRDTEIDYDFPTSSSGPFAEDVPGHWLAKREFVELYARTVRDHSGCRLAPRTNWWDIHAARL